MKASDRCFDVGLALFGGYRVALMVGLRCDGQALFETANDVAAAAALMRVAVLSADETVIAACKALGVATALPPPFDRKAWRYEREEAMIESQSTLIRAGRGRVRVLRLAYDGRRCFPARYVARLGRGCCRICGCTDAVGCVGGCAWANSRQTLCTRCEERIAT